MNLHHKLKIFFFLLIASSSLSYGQSDENIEAYNWFDEVVGLSNTGLLNGVEYVETHRTINEFHKFFVSQDFLPGAVVYDGQPYYDLQLKYNVFDQVLLVGALDNNNVIFFQLIKEKISDFQIADHKFTNVKLSPSNSDVEGFYEILLENEELQVLKKHSKSLSEGRDKQFVYYEFKEDNNDYVLQHQDEYYTIDSRRDVFRVFPDLRREIREFYSSQRSLRKSNPDTFMINLFRDLTPRVANKNSTGV